MTRYFFIILTSAFLASGAFAEQPLSNLVFNDMAGITYDLDQLSAAEKPIVFVYWQPWCAPCKKEAPAIVKAAAAHAGHLQFFGVVSGKDELVDAKHVQTFIEKSGFTFPQIRDKDLSMTKEMDIAGTPTVIIVGKGNQVLYRGHQPPEDWTKF